jgi:hypothetical protein
MTHTGYCIKAKEPGAKRSYRFGGSELTALKIKAIRYASKEAAQVDCDKLAAITLNWNGG